MRSYETSASSAFSAVKIVVPLVVAFCFGCSQQSSPSSPLPSKMTATVPVEQKPAPIEKKPITEDQLGLKFYPGGKLKENQVTDKSVMANFETTDSPDKAAAFYEGELGGTAKNEPPFTTIEGKKGDMKYTVVVTHQGGITSVSIMGEKAK